MLQLFNQKLPLSETNNCTSLHNDLALTVYDDPQTWCVTNHAKFHSRIINNAGKPFYIIALDKCCLDCSFVGMRCDYGIIIENEQLFLVEIKETQFPKFSKRKRSVLQLENTIVFFLREGLTDPFPKLSAVVNWGFKPTRQIVNTSFQSARVKFRSLYGFELLEGNEIVI